MHDIRAFVQSGLQLIRLSRGQSPLEQCGVKGLAPGGIVHGSVMDISLILKGSNKVLPFFLKTPFQEMASASARNTVKIYFIKTKLLPDSPWTEVVFSFPALLGNSVTCRILRVYCISFITRVSKTGCLNAQLKWNSTPNLPVIVTL